MSALAGSLPRLRERYERCIDDGSLNTAILLRREIEGIERHEAAQLALRERIRQELWLLDPEGANGITVADAYVALDRAMGCAGTAGERCGGTRRLKGGHIWAGRDVGRICPGCPDCRQPGEDEGGGDGRRSGKGCEGATRNDGK